MFKTYSPLMLASLIGIGAFAMPVSSASAAALPYVQQSTGQVTQDGNPLLQDVKHNKGWNGNWNGNWKGHGNRRGHWRHRGGHRHGFGNFGYFAAPFIVGGLLASGDYYGHSSSRHVRWCLNNYPNSYDPQDNTWVAFNGRV